MLCYTLVNSKFISCDRDRCFHVGICSLLIEGITEPKNYLNQPVELVWSIFLINAHVIMLFECEY